MTKSEKKVFIRNVCASIRDELISKIDSGAIPEEWDGIELRQLLAEKADGETYPTMLTHKRLKDYKNTVIVNNL
jgi:hypothetical protein